MLSGEPALAVNEGARSYFLTDREVALALASTADWYDGRVPHYQLAADGSLVSGHGVVDGVVAEVDDDSAIIEYFNGLDGAIEVDSTVAGDRVRLVVAQSEAVGFSLQDRRIEALVAMDVARILADPLETNTPVNRAGLVMRARSAVRGQEEFAPVGVRVGYGVKDVEVVERKLPYARYFDVEDLTLRHRRFDGEMSSPVVRSVLRSADAVTVLPYDPVRDSIVLVEQFRPGAFTRGDSKPWVLEPVAGRCDGAEPVEEVARREMVEEAGLILLGLEPVGTYYPSPGCLTEYLYSFVGLVDLSGVEPGVHGLDSEGEDIRTHLVSYDDALALLESGEADNGPMLLSLYWLMAHRTRLQEAAGVA